MVSFLSILVLLFSYAMNTFSLQGLVAALPQALGHSKRATASTRSTQVQLQFFF